MYFARCILQCHVILTLHFARCLLHDHAFCIVHFARSPSCILHARSVHFARSPRSPDWPVSELYFAAHGAVRSGYQVASAVWPMELSACTGGASVKSPSKPISAGHQLSSARTSMVVSNARECVCMSTYANTPSGRSASTMDASETPCILHAQRDTHEDAALGTVHCASTVRTSSATRWLAPGQSAHIARGPW